MSASNEKTPPKQKSSSITATIALDEPAGNEQERIQQDSVTESKAETATEDVAYPVSATDQETLVITEDTDYDPSHTLAECQKLHEAGKYRKIIKLIEAIPEESRTPEIWSELGRAYNNAAKPGDTETLRKALECLLPQAQFLGEDHRWNFRVGYALYYLDLEMFALPYFEDALKYLPGDEDTQNFINQCKACICVPHFSQTFNAKCKEKWKEFAKREQAWRDQITNTNPDTYHQILSEIGQEIAGIFAPFPCSMEVSCDEAKPNDFEFALVFSIDNNTKFLEPLRFLSSLAPKKIRANWRIDLGSKARAVSQVQIQDVVLNASEIMVKIVDHEAIERQDADQRLTPTGDTDSVQFDAAPTKTEQAADAVQIRVEDAAGAAGEDQAVVAVAEGANGAVAPAGDKPKPKELYLKYIILISHPMLAKLDQEADESKDPNTIEKLNQCYNAVFSLIRHSIGEKAMLFAIEAIRINKNGDMFDAAEGEAFPLTQIAERMTALGYDLDMPLEDFVEYRKVLVNRQIEFDESFWWREDIYNGSTSAPYFTVDFFNREYELINTLIQQKIAVGFLAFAHEKEMQTPNQLPLERIEFLDKMSEIINEDKRASIVSKFLGLEHDYLDILAFDNIASIFERIEKYMLEHKPAICHHVHFVPFRAGFGATIYDADDASNENEGSQQNEATANAAEPDDMVLPSYTSELGGAEDSPSDAVAAILVDSDAEIQDAKVDLTDAASSESKTKAKGQAQSKRKRKASPADSD